MRKQLRSSKSRKVASRKTRFPGYDIITVGSGLVDAFVPAVGKEKNKKLEIQVGTKIPVEIIVSSGGGGTNTATCISKLGLKVGFLGKIGSGHNSEIILRELKKSKIDFLGARTKEHTGYSIILETNKKHRTILTHKGASNQLKLSEVKLGKLKTKWFHFTSMWGESLKTQEKLSDFAVKNNIKISFNPGLRQIKERNKQFFNILKNTHVVSMNLEEAKTLVGNKKEFKDLFKELHKLGPKIACITNGEHEGGVCDGKYLYKFKPHKVKVGECTGAGDAFASSFIVGLIKFNDIEKAIRLALVNSEAVIKERGAKNGLLSMSEAINKIKTHKFKIEKQLL